MKKQTTLLLVSTISIAVLMLNMAIYTGNLAYPYEESHENQEMIKLGYCPTMHEDAESLAASGGYELVMFSSAAEALSALKGGQIKSALIGRKAKPMKFLKTQRKPA